MASSLLIWPRLFQASLGMGGGVGAEGCERLIDS